MMKKAIVIGATSGIGKSIARILADKGFRVGITGRRTELLNELQAEQPEKYVPFFIDVTDIPAIPDQLGQLVKELGGLDLLIISAGTGNFNETLDFKIEKRTIDLNVLGFTAVTDWAFNYFLTQKSGHLAGITSIAGIRGSKSAPAYNATKAYQINYLEGLRQKAKSSNHDMVVTDIRPGFVDTAMAKGEGQFWVSGVDKAGQQIFRALEKKRKVVYITKRWKLIAILLKLIPGWIYNRM